MGITIMRSGRLHFVDFLRVSSVLYIVGFWHVMNYTGVFPGYANAVTFRITVAILGLFVFLSGYLLATRPVALTPQGLLSFYARRLIRIWPLYVVALALYVAFGLTDATTALLSSAGLTMFFGEPPLTLWFIAMLLVLYFVAPLLIATSNQPWLFAAICAALYTVGVLLHVDGHLLLYAPAFGLGIFHARNNFAIPRWLVVTSAIVAIIVSAYALNPEASAYSIGLASIVPLAVFITLQSLGPKLPTYRAVKFMSTAALAMYLIHRPFYMTMLTIFPIADSYSRLAFIWLVCLPVLILIAYFIQTSYDALVARIWTFSRLHLKASS